MLVKHEADLCLCVMYADCEWSRNDERRCGTRWPSRCCRTPVLSHTLFCRVRMIPRKAPNIQYPIILATSDTNSQYQCRYLCKISKLLWWQWLCLINSSISAWCPDKRLCLSEYKSQAELNNHSLTCGRCRLLSDRYCIGCQNNQKISPNNNIIQISVNIAQYPITQRQYRSNPICYQFLVETCTK